MSRTLKELIEDAANFTPTSYDERALRIARAIVRRAAEVVRTYRGGFTANISIHKDDPELVRDADGEWGFSGDFADAILIDAGMKY